MRCFPYNVWPAVWFLETAVMWIMRWGKRARKSRSDGGSKEIAMQELRGAAVLARMSRFIGHREEGIIVSASRLAATPLGHGLDRMSVGIGMIPRGEVGLIFAASGQTSVTGGRPVIDAGVYTAIVVMVMITTLIAPPLLGWSLRRHRPSTTVAPHQEL